MRGAPRALLLAGLLSAASLSARTAHGYVRSVTDDGSHQLKWLSSCETVTIYLNGFSAMTPDEVAKSIGAAAAAWGPDSVTCPAQVGDAGDGHPYFEILPQLAIGGSVPALPNADGKNSIVFETTSSPDLGPEVLASTGVSKDRSGRIVEADIEINAASLDIVWANLDPGAPPPKNDQLRFDLQTVMTHEFGHFLGLAHTCVGTDSTPGGDGDSPPPGSKDNEEQLIPDCTPYADSSIATQAAAVMWYVVDQESIIKRVLTPDDARGVCAVYPATLDPNSCTQNTPDDGCGCATTGTQANHLAALATVALVLATRRRRRRRT